MKPYELAYGLPPRKVKTGKGGRKHGDRNLSTVKIQWIHRMRAQGKSYGQIAEALNLDRSTVAKRCKSARELVV